MREEADMAPKKDQQLKPGDVVTHGRRRYRIVQANGDRAALVETVSGDYSTTYLNAGDLKLAKNQDDDQDDKPPAAGDAAGDVDE